MKYNINQYQNESDYVDVPCAFLDIASTRILNNGEIGVWDETVEKHIKKKFLMCCYSTSEEENELVRILTDLADQGLVSFNRNANLIIVDCLAVENRDAIWDFLCLIFIREKIPLTILSVIDLQENKNNQINNEN